MCGIPTPSLTKGACSSDVTLLHLANYQPTTLPLDVDGLPHIVAIFILSSDVGPCATIKWMTS